VVFDDDVDIDKLLPSTIRLFDGTQLRFDLMYCRLLGTGSFVEPIGEADAVFSRADEILQQHGWAPENRLALQGTPQALMRQMEDYSLIVTCLPQLMEADNELMRLIGDTPSPVLLYRQ